MNAIAQHDLKKLLAYHSIENIGIIGIGIGLGMLGLASHQDAVALLGFFGAILHVFNHFTFKSLLFYGAGVVYAEDPYPGHRPAGRPGPAPAAHVGPLPHRLAGHLRAAPVQRVHQRIRPVFRTDPGAGHGRRRDERRRPGRPRPGLAFIGVMAVLCFTKVFGIVFLGSPARRRIREPVTEGSALFLAPMFALTALILFVGIVRPAGRCRSSAPWRGRSCRAARPPDGPISSRLFRGLSPALAAAGRPDRSPVAGRPGTAPAPQARRPLQDLGLRIPDGEPPLPVHGELVRRAVPAADRAARSPASSGSSPPDGLVPRRRPRSKAMDSISSTPAWSGRSTAPDPPLPGTVHLDPERADAELHPLRARLPGRPDRLDPGSPLNVPIPGLSRPARGVAPLHRR